jgi:membrane protein implicated in regulation of membrane protease activity
MDWAIWLVVAVVALIAEATTTAFFTVYFAAGAVAALLLSLVGVGLAGQIAAFAVVSAGGLWLTRPWLLRVAGDHSPVVPSGVEAMRGRVGVVTKPIGELESGQVRIAGETWSARPYFEQEPIPAGARVEVVEVRGVTALVIPAPSDPNDEPKEP